MSAQAEYFEQIIIKNTKTNKQVNFLISIDMPEEELNDIIESMEINMI